MGEGEKERRAQILEAAERLLRHYGPQKTTIADVAREANIGVGTVYLEFSSKEALIEELSNERHRRVLEAMRAAAANPRKRFRSRLEAVLEARVTCFVSIADEGAHACDLVHCVSPAVKSASKRFRDEEHLLLVTLLRDAAASGEFELRAPEATAQSLLRAYVTFTPPWIFAASREDLLRALRDMHDLIFQGLLARRVRP